MQTVAGMSLNPSGQVLNVMQQTGNGSSSKILEIDLDVQTLENQSVFNSILHSIDEHMKDNEMIPVIEKLIDHDSNFYELSKTGQPFLNGMIINNPVESTPDDSLLYLDADENIIVENLIAILNGSDVLNSNKTLQDCTVKVDALNSQAVGQTNTSNIDAETFATQNVSVVDSNLLSSNRNQENGFQRHESIATTSDKETESDFSMNHVAEKVVKMIRKMSGESGGNESFSDLLSDDETVERVNLAGIQSFVDTSGLTEEIIDKTAAVEKALNQMINEMKYVESGSTEIKIVLEPEHFGELSIFVSRTENGISAKIKSNDSEVCAIIGDHIQMLIQSMENKGLQIKDVHVVYSDMEQNLTFSQGNSGENNQGEPHSYFAQREENVKTTENSILSDLLRTGLGNEDASTGVVEYRI